jgi:hypothetical protein
MFITDTFIDTVSNGKKQFVNTVFAQNKTIADALNGFVDAQTAYTKQAVKAGTDTATKLGSEAVKLATDAAKFDFAKSFEQFTSAFQVKK